MMNTLRSTSAFAIAVVAINGAASASPLSGLPNYIPSSGITFEAGIETAAYGSGGAVPVTGHQLIDQFQLNLLYDQPNSTNAEAENFDDWAGNNGGASAAPNTNWHDPEYYYLNVNPGAAETYDYDNDGDSGNNNTGMFFDWTITGWTNTILAGNLHDNDMSGGLSDGDYLEVVGGYMSFGAGANSIEVWNGSALETEVVGYSVSGNGLTPELVRAVPEPSSLMMLGMGAFGLMGYARRRRQSSVCK